MTLVRFPVAVIMQRTPLASRWASERWEPVAVEVVSGESTDPAPRCLGDDATGSRWRIDGHAIELHRSEAEGYYLNVTAPEPKVFVMWRATDGDGAPPVTPVIVTVSYHEAARMLDGGEQVDAVPMPRVIHAAIETFVAVHYRPEPKRKVRRNDPFADEATSRERQRSR